MSIGIAVIWVEPSVAETLGPNARKGCSHKKKRRPSSFTGETLEIPRRPPSSLVDSCTAPGRRSLAHSPKIVAVPRAPQFTAVRPKFAFSLLPWRPLPSPSSSFGGGPCDECTVGSTVFFPCCLSPPPPASTVGSVTAGCRSPSSSRRPLLPLLPLPSRR
jgi:hypothetical protein